MPPASSGDIEEMERVLRDDPTFVDLVSLKHREKELARLDARIAALQRAKSELDATPVKRMPKKQYKSAAYWCRYNDWSEEDAAAFLREHARRKQTRGGSNASGVFAGIGRVGQAVMLG